MTRHGRSTPTAGSRRGPTSGSCRSRRRRPQAARSAAATGCGPVRGPRPVVALQLAGPFATNDPADVRWLLCGRGRPVSAGSSPYAVELTESAARVWYQDIERARVEAEERWEELGYEPSPYAWFEPLPLLVTTRHLQGLRLELGREEVERYRKAASDAAGALVDVLGTIHPEQRELDVAGALA